jgi:hypothetical protein
MVEHLSLQIAAGILIAAAIMFAFRCALALWADGERWPAVYLGGAALLAGGTLIAAGLGAMRW